MKFSKKHLPAFQYVEKQLKKQIKMMKASEIGYEMLPVDVQCFTSPYVCDLVVHWAKNTQNEISSEIKNEIADRIDYAFSVTDWLRKNHSVGYGYLENWRDDHKKSVQMQSYRLAWVQQMIKECKS